MLKEKVALCDIAKIEELQIFVSLENETLYEDLYTHKFFKSCYGYFV